MKKDNENLKRLIEMDLHTLDCYASKLEAVYGIGNLLKWMPDDFQNKWIKQNEKLAHAVGENDANAVKLIVQGCIRAWDMMEENAIKNNKRVNEPEFFEIKLDSGFHLRIAKNVSEARSVSQGGVYVWSLGEVARVIESDYTLVNCVKDVFPDAEVVRVDETMSEKGV